MSVTPASLTDAFLDEKRKQGDPLADVVVGKLIDTGEIEVVDRDLLRLLRNDQLVPEDMPAPLRDYLDMTAGPLNIDADVVRRGQEVFGSYGPEVLMVLGFLALPAAYAARRGVQVLYRTAFLEERPMRRVLETSRMVATVMSPEGLAPSGDGLRIMQKVRLMHAGIRHMLVHEASANDPWDTADLGIPINQEDLAGTLMTFSYMVLVGLEQLHIEIPGPTQEAYVQMWSAIGERMGLDDDLNPTTVAEAKALTERIRERQIEPSPEGVAMTRALIEGYAEWVDGIPNSAPASMVHFFLDDDAVQHQNVAAMLEVPSAGILGFLPHVFADLLRAVSFLFGRGPVQARLGRWMSGHIVAGLLNASAEARGATFSIPDHVRDDWKLPKSAGTV